jgi:hypothetical protein
MPCPNCHKPPHLRFRDLLMISRPVYRSKIPLPKRIVICSHCGTLLRETGFTKLFWCVAGITIVPFLLVFIFFRQIVAIVGIKEFESFFIFIATLMILGFMSYGLKRSMRYEVVDPKDVFADHSEG